MKKNLTYAGAALLLLLGVACNKEENFVLENTYHLDKLLVAEGAGFNDELYTFTVELAEEGVTGAAGSYSGTGKVVSYQFYGSKYYLDSSVYPAVAAGSESDASYVAAQSTVYDVANGTVTAKGISDGYVYVSKSGTDYRFGTTSKLSDGSEFKFVSGVKIDFPKLPKYKYVNKPIQAYQRERSHGKRRGYRRGTTLPSGVPYGLLAGRRYVRRGRLYAWLPERYLCGLGRSLG